mgnify:CR=1 FL=1
MEPGGITTFRDKILKNLVREILQNSLDNPADENQEVAIRVRFSDKNIPRQQIPGLTSLEEQLDLCVEASSNAATEQKEEVNVQLKCNPQQMPFNALPRNRSQMWSPKKEIIHWMLNVQDFH